MSEISKVLDNNEQVLWEGRPAFWPFVFNSAGCSTFIFGAFWSGFMVFGLSSIMAADNSFTGGGFPYYIFAIPHFYVGPIMMFGGPIYRILVHRFTHYAITNRRVIIQQGLIGRDFHVVDFDQITNVSVNVDLFDKIFMQGTGSVLVSSPSSVKHTKHGQVPAPYELDSIPNPYEVFKNLKQASLNVKTDINYPNALRPKINPGYNSDLGNNPFDTTAPIGQ